MTYQDWYNRYTTLFGLTASEGDMAMVAEFCGLFERNGYTPEELSAATDWLALNCPPDYPTKHLPRLQARLHQQRIAAAASPPGEEDEWGTCSTCSGSGMVSVPCPRCLARGIWGTAAVLCSCALGRFTGQRQQGDTATGEPRLPLMSLDDYQSLHPDWRDRLAAHEELHRRGAEAQTAGKEMHPIVARILSRLKAGR